MKDKCKIKNLPIPLKKRANDPSEKPVFEARKPPFAWRGCVKTWIFHSKHHGKTFLPPCVILIRLLLYYGHLTEYYYYKNNYNRLYLSWHALADWSPHGYFGFTISCQNMNHGLSKFIWKAAKACHIRYTG